MALSRPPRTDQFRLYRLAARDGYEAELIAQQWAGTSPGVVMATESLVVDWPVEASKENLLRRAPQKQCKDRADHDRHHWTDERGLVWSCQGRGRR